MNNHLKRSTTILIVLSILAATTVVVYAVAVLFFRGESQTSDYNKKAYFEIMSSEFFSSSGEVGPGESMSVNPVITSDATEDMYVFIRVEISKYGDGGLYTLTPDFGWNLVEDSVEDDKHVAVYRYDTVLEPGESTSALSGSLTMVDMSKLVYSELSDINVTMTGYACGTEGIEMEDAWESVKENYGL